MASSISVSDIAARKGGTPIAVLTCYTAGMAKLLDPHVDILLVGDSLGMVLYGMENTQGVTLDIMINHAKAVAKSSARALVAVDLPYHTYESKEQALISAQRTLSETGAKAVKLEGGKDKADIIRYLVAHDIPVIGHVGLMPQRVSTPDGYRYKGRTPEEASAILEDAKAVEAAGAFALVIEAVKEEVARQITAQVKIPTIGIGASNACDGQVLVIDDMLGMGSGYVPSFVKHYAHISDAITQAVKTYVEEVRGRVFPGPDQCFGLKK